MGNRAVITWSKNQDYETSDELGIYLHWCGGRDSVEALLGYCKKAGFRPPNTDNYGYARFCQVACNYLGKNTGLSVGIDRLKNLDCNNWDNGVYICEGWNIVGRDCIPEGFEEQNSYDPEELDREIEKANK